LTPAGLSEVVHSHRNLETLDAAYTIRLICGATKVNIRTEGFSERETTMLVPSDS
jgi:hypothetical protein